MSLQPEAIGPIPEETARVARAAFPDGATAMRVRDALGTIYEDEAFADLFSTRGRPAEAPWRLALVSVLQFAEALPDRKAADAVRGRIDWKYALGLELIDPGFDASVLSEFRARLATGAAERLLLDTLLACCRERGWLKAGGRQRTDSTHVLAAIRALNRIEVVAETMRHALDSLAVASPDWLAARVPPEWVERYARRAEDDRLPAGKEAREALALVIGADGHALLDAVDAVDAPAWLRTISAVATLRRVWVQQFYREEGGIGGRLHWRTDRHGLPPASLFISSPYDPDAHLARKRTTQWVGYKVHLTETCEDDVPNLITHVETTPAPVADGALTPAIHAALEDKQLLPVEHLLDTGYLDAELFATIPQAYGVDLIGPTRPDVKPQARAGQGFAAAAFTVDWERQQAVCPEGHTSSSWTPAVDNRKNDVIKIKFSGTDCAACPSRAQCIDPRAKRKIPRRSLTVRPEAQYYALRAARQRERTPAFAALYRKRAGIEGTISQGVRASRLRRTRYIGLAKTHLGHILTAVAVNLLRIGAWLAGVPRAKTRQSAFATLMTPVA
jgi:transposase